MFKKILLICFLTFSFNLHSQETIELDLTDKEYRKILKKLDLKIVNRGYDGSGLVWVKCNGSSTSKATPKQLWDAALFEINMPIGSIVSQTEDVVTIDADWIIDIKSGSYAFRVLDFRDNSKVAATVSTAEKMWISKTQGKRANEYKDYVKVMLNELLLTIN
jgi:hypothetical protein